LSEAQKEKEIIEREHKQLTSRTQNNSSMLDTQEEHLARAKDIAAEADTKYEEAMKKFKVLEEDVDNLESEAEGIEVQNNELSAENKLLASTLKSYQAMETSLGKKEAKAGDEIVQISSQLEKSLAACGDMVDKRDKLSAFADELEEELTKVQEEKKTAESELEETVRELGSI